MTDKAKKNKNEYIKSYKREKCVHICLQLNKKTDADIIKRLGEVPNKCGYIKQLIREEIEEFEIVQGLKGGRVNERGRREMIIIGTEKEIEAMIKGTCPHTAKHNAGSCDGDCHACWNKAASIVIVRPEKIGMIEKDVDGVPFLERLKERGCAE